jgi:hypothetical protein
MPQPEPALQIPAQHTWASHASTPRVTFCCLSPIALESHFKQRPCRLLMHVPLHAHTPSLLLQRCRRDSLCGWANSHRPQLPRRRDGDWQGFSRRARCYQLGELNAPISPMLQSCHGYAHACSFVHAHSALLFCIGQPNQRWLATHSVQRPYIAAASLIK